MTLSLVSTVTVGAGGAASISFTGIAGTATDLLIVVSAASSKAEWTSDGLLMTLNGSSANFSGRILYGYGSGVGSTTVTNEVGIVNAGAATASTFGNASIYLANYAGSTNKSYSTDAVSENNATAAAQRITAGLWSNTTAVTSLTLSCGNGNFIQNSTASLYTITKGSGGASVS